MYSDKLNKARKLLYIALCADIVISIIILSTSFFSVIKLRDIASGKISASPDLLTKMEIFDNFYNFGILSIIIVGILIVHWLRACYVYAREVIGASGFKNEKWTIWGWIVPFINLFKPYQILKEIYKIGNPNYETPEGWKKKKGSFLLLMWWWFWVLAHLIIFSLSKLMLANSDSSSMTMRQVINILEISGIIYFLFLLIAGLWFVVVGSVTQRLLDQKKTLKMLPNNIKDIVAKSNGSLENQLQNFVPTGFDELDAYRTIASEIESGNMDKGLWLKAMIQSGEADENKRTIAYTSLRLEQLHTEFLAKENNDQPPIVDSNLDKSNFIERKVEVLPIDHPKEKVTLPSKKNLNLMWGAAILIAGVVITLGVSYILNGKDSKVKWGDNDKFVDSATNQKVGDPTTPNLNEYNTNQSKAMNEKLSSAAKGQLIDLDKVELNSSPPNFVHKSIVLTDGFTTGKKIHMLGGGNVKKPYVGFILNIKTKMEDSLVLSGSYDFAFKIYEELDKKGDATASHNIGLMYIRGMGVSKDIQTGMRFLDKAMVDPANYNTSIAYYIMAEKELLSSQ